MTTRFGWAALVAVFVAGLWAAAPASAQDPDVRPSPSQRQVVYDCLENARNQEWLKIAALCVGSLSSACTAIPDNQTTIGMSVCFAKEKIIWDELLNDWYGSARERLSAEAGKSLRDAQRLWIKWRDAKCKFAYAKYDGGTLGISTSAYCTMETTALRALELRDLVIEFEGR